VSAFVDERRGDFGVEPVCRALGVSACRLPTSARPASPRARAAEDERLLALIGEVHSWLSAVTGGRSVSP